jgi:NADH:ubiquinone oxidoreductase subunit E
MNGLSSHEWHSNESPVHDRVKELEKQRDELLAALKKITRAKSAWEAQASAIAAIASVKESK